ncbi:MAG: hypothetical protein RIC89_07590 [Pseudomonadales bacterium]
MPHVSETIPDALTPRVEAALAWFNASSEASGDEFKVTGILDPEEALSGSDELRLIMCSGDRCEQRSFTVAGSSNAWSIEFSDKLSTQAEQKPQAELDPPPGVRTHWLDKTLSQHAFTILLFYRGFW